MIPIFTFVTERDGYSQMRDSFERAGFTSDRASFTELSSTGQPGEPEPYSTITELATDLSEAYFILCHQDVRLDQGHGIDDLIGAMRELEERDDRWAVAGNAGGSRALRVVRSLVDPHGGGTHDSLPARVHSLDENFLVIRTGSGVRCSPQLNGFHLYGTDLCLNALEQGRQPYVIDFRVRHLSRGTRDAEYVTARDRLIAHWSSRFVACYVRTTIEVLFLSRLGFLRSLLGRAGARSLVKSRPAVRMAAGTLLAPRPRKARIAKAAAAGWRYVHRAGMRLLGPLTHIVGRVSGRHYFEDYVRVYPGGVAYNRLGLRRRAQEKDLRNFRNHLRFYEFAAQFATGRRVVDAGCGAGYGCKVLYDAGASEVFGTDLSRHALRFARRHFDRYASFSRQSLTALREYPDAFADLVLSSEVLEHIKEYGLEDRAIGELRRITRPGGLLVLATPNSELLGSHGFSWDELSPLFSSHFDEFCIFENALVPFEPPARSAWQDRAAGGRTGVVVSQRIVLEETVVPAGARAEVKSGLEPGAFEFSNLIIDTTLLHNTHSWVVLAVAQ